FFQAEDGIRDPLVTGVQTCALPIFEAPPKFHRVPATFDHTSTGETEKCSVAPTFPVVGIRSERSTGPEESSAAARTLRSVGQTRSEERRVGKECRSGGWRGARRRKR